MNNARPFVSCIIINWNGAAVLPQCLASLFKVQYKPIEIIVVDNASTDDSAQIGSKYSDRVKWIQNDKNYGYAKSCNIGISKSLGKYIALLNNDVVVSADWVDKVICFLENHSNVGIISSRQMSLTDPLMIDALFHEIIRSLIFCEFGHAKRDLSIPPSYVISANGASPVFRREIFDALGGFDEDFFAYHEECDFFFRALKKGWKCVYLPDALIFHFRAYSFKKRTAFSYYHFERSRWIFLLKNYPLCYLLKNIYFLTGKEIQLLFISFSNPRMCLAYLHARISAIGYFLTFRWFSRKASDDFYKHLGYISSLKTRKYIPVQ